jgi:hypothetical protein
MIFFSGIGSCYAGGPAMTGLPDQVRGTVFRGPRYPTQSHDVFQMNSRYFDALSWRPFAKSTEKVMTGV